MPSFYCLFTAQYPPTVGGVENYNQNLARQLVQNGHRVIIVTSELTNLPRHEVDGSGVEILRLPSWQLMGGRLPVIKPFNTTKKLLRNAFSQGVERAVINTRFYPLSLFAASFAKKNAIPCIVIEHGSAHLSFGNAFLDIILKCYEHIVCRLVRSYCNRFYAVSSRSARWLNHFGITALGVVPNAIDCNKVDGVSPSLFDAKKFGIADNDKVICYVGRMIPEKGVDELVKAFGKISQQYPNLRLVMAGDGAMLSHLESYRLKNVVFCGKLMHDECISLMKRAEIFCLPTVSEGFSTTLLEAVACRCFVITTEGCGGASEVFTDKVSGGYIMKKGDEDSIIDAVHHALAADLSSIIDNEKRVREKMGWQNSADILDRAFQ